MRHNPGARLTTSPKLVLHPTADVAADLGDGGFRGAGSGLHLDGLGELDDKRSEERLSAECPVLVCFLWGRQGVAELARRVVVLLDESLDRHHGRHAAAAGPLRGCGELAGNVGDKEQAAAAEGIGVVWEHGAQDESGPQVVDLDPRASVGPIHVNPGRPGGVTYGVGDQLGHRKLCTVEVRAGDCVTVEVLRQLAAQFAGHGSVGCIKEEVHGPQRS